ncbi:hypothetical protein H9W95_08185 [Flavobacterium lindanitolerans]|nr:hypothetical protein [Flavobacterium lindanitolerans]
MRKELLFASIIGRLLPISFYRFSTILDRLIHKCVRKRIVIPMFLLFISIGAHAQMALETFESGIPPTWASFRNNVGTLNWGISPDSYRGTGAAFLNPSAENIGAGNTAQYFRQRLRFRFLRTGKSAFIQNRQLMPIMGPSTKSGCLQQDSQTRRIYRNIEIPDRSRP